LSSQFDSTARVIDDICLMFPSTDVRKSWSEGQEICQQQNGNLWNPRSAQNGDNVKAAFDDIFHEVTVELFLGLNDLSEEGNWVFSTGDAYDIQFPWYYSEPNNGGEGGDQDCGMLKFRYHMTLTSYFYDQECHELRYFICEFVN